MILNMFIVGAVTGVVAVIGFVIAFLWEDRRRKRAHREWQRPWQNPQFMQNLIRQTPPATWEEFVAEGDGGLSDDDGAGK